MSVNTCRLTLVDNEHVTYVSAHVFCLYLSLVFFSCSSRADASVGVPAVSMHAPKLAVINSLCGRRWPLITSCSNFFHCSPDGFSYAIHSRSEAGNKKRKITENRDGIRERLTFKLGPAHGVRFDVHPSVTASCYMHTACFLVT